MTAGKSKHSATLDLDYILMQLDSISETLDLVEKTQMLQCNLTVSFTHPENPACLVERTQH
uniref:Si:ch211-232m8.3 n=1 Tax=Astyanax mexicanus TaxID=7994 RepID=A0A3B1IR83_ASTMX